MKVMLVEPFGSGHHMSLHIRFAVKKLQSLNCELSLLTRRSAVTDPSFQTVKKEITKDMPIFFLPELKYNKSSRSLSILVRQIREWLILKREFLKLVKINKPDVIYVSDLEWIAKATEILGSPFSQIPFVALYMSPKHHRKTMSLGPKSRYDWIYDKLFQRLLKIPTLQKLITMDEIFYEFSKQRYKNSLKKILLAPDFALIEGNLSKETARENLGIFQSAKVILVYGTLDLKKGIKELLTALEVGNLPDNLVVLLSGRPSEEIIEFMKSKKIKELLENKKIVTSFKFHDSRDEQEAFVASDVVWLGYTNVFFGSSGVLYQAIHADLPIIGQKDGLIGHYVKKYNLGKTVDVDNIKNVSKVINDLFDKIEIYIQNKKFRENLKKYHSPEKHGQILYEAISKIEN